MDDNGQGGHLPPPTVSGAAPLPPPDPGHAKPPVRWWAKKRGPLPMWAWITVAVVVIGAIGSATNKKDESTTRGVAGVDTKATDQAIEETVPADDSLPKANTVAVTDPPATEAATSPTVVPTDPPTTPAPTDAPTTNAEPTTTAAPTTTEPPTTTTVARVTFTGRGDDVVDIGPANDRLVLHAEHDGRSNFVVELLDADLQRIDLTVNEIGPFAGTMLLTSFAEPSDVRYLQVTADGNWSLELVDVTALPVVEDAFYGQGQSVLVYQGDGGIFSVTHDGESNFAVIVISGSGQDLLINEIGAYDGRVPFPSGPAFVAITADGTWVFQS